MEDSKEMLLPGTVATQHGEKGFGKIEVLLAATGGLTLSQVCAVTGLEGSTIQNWVKRGWVTHPRGKKYEEIHIARILIINALKECIKLETIAKLMTYVNGAAENHNDSVIKESELYNFLCDALHQLGQVQDLSRSGVESVVEAVVKDYKDSTPYARFKIRKALTVMIYACVCTDVKRRTESMMQQVMHELENPEIIMKELMEKERAAEQAPEPVQEKVEPQITVAEEISKGGEESRKTVAQALREWDLTQVENILNEDSGYDVPEPSSNSNAKTAPPDKTDKSAQKPWYFRRN